MAGFLARRSAQMVIVLVGVTMIAFILENLIASGPRLAHALLGPRANAAQIAAFVHEYGLDEALPVRYLAFLWQLVHGNLGFSFKQNESVDAIVLQDLPKDALLVGSSIVLGLFIAVPVGMWQAAKRNRPTDYLGTAVAFGLYSMPAFWLGLLLIGGFSISLHLFPSEAPQATSFGAIVTDPQALVLPITTLTLINYALFSRYVRGSTIEQAAQDYVRSAQAKGVPTSRVYTRHLMRNSLGPVMTLLGLALPGIITNGLIVEIVFNFPGLGLSFFNAAQNLDYPVELGITVLVAIATVVGSLFADIAYAVLDPRVRMYGAAR